MTCEKHRADARYLSPIVPASDVLRRIDISGEYASISVESFSDHFQYDSSIVFSTEASVPNSSATFVCKHIRWRTGIDIYLAPSSFAFKHCSCSMSLGDPPFCYDCPDRAQCSQWVEIFHA